MRFYSFIMGDQLLQRSLFYLMVLINCHTISKSIANDEKTLNDIIDSVNEFEFTTEKNLRHERYHHKYRRRERGVPKDLVSSTETPVTITGKSSFQTPRVSRSNTVADQPNANKTQHTTHKSTSLRSTTDHTEDPGSLWNDFIKNIDSDPFDQITHDKTVESVKFTRSMTGKGFKRKRHARRRRYTFDDKEDESGYSRFTKILHFKPKNSVRTTAYIATTKRYTADKLYKTDDDPVGAVGTESKYYDVPKLYAWNSKKAVLYSYLPYPDDAFSRTMPTVHRYSEYYKIPEPSKAKKKIEKLAKKIEKEKKRLKEKEKLLTQTEPMPTERLIRVEPKSTKSGWKKAKAHTAKDKQAKRKKDRPTSKKYASQAMFAADLLRDLSFGTAELESLIQEIKNKELQAMKGHSAPIIDLINNSVTETSFSAYQPFATAIPKPQHRPDKAGYRGSDDETLIRVEDVPHNIILENDDKFQLENVFPDINVNETIAVTMADINHELQARSVKEEITKIYSGAADMQKKFKDSIKDMYNNAKSKLNKEYGTVKSSTKKVLDETAHELTKIANKLETPETNRKGHRKISKFREHAKSQTVNIPKAKHRHSGRPEEHVERKAATGGRKPWLHFSPASEEVTLPTLEDDYAMLKVFEQVLSKRHEENAIKSFTTPHMVEKRGVKGNMPLLKRNPETIEDLALKENIRKLNEGEGMPAAYDIPLKSGDNFDRRYNTYDVHSFFDSTTTEKFPTTNSIDGSYEGLTSKISYNEYINGYKHYLNFAKEMGEDHFSNMVRYQAHRHHSVDDIGKFILSKLPPLPTRTLYRSKRYFFDDSDSEEQDFSTKNDDSWFKKHFYMFLDTAPQKRSRSKMQYPVEIYLQNAGASKSIRKAITDNYRSTVAYNLLTLQNNSLLDLKNDLTELEKAINEDVTVLPTLPDDTSNDQMPSTVDRIETTTEEDYGLSSEESSRYRRNSAVESHTLSLRSNHKHRKSNLFDRAAKYTSTTAEVHDDEKYKNIGFVDVSLVTQPVDRPEKTEKKEGRLKKLFHKLKPKKRLKSKHHFDVVKRQVPSRRQQRYNPFKKLKNMFSTKSRMEDNPGYTGDDAEIMTTDTPATLFGKVPNMADIYKEIPHINAPNSSSEYLPQISHSKTNSGSNHKGSQAANRHHPAVHQPNNPSMTTVVPPVVLNQPSEVPSEDEEKRNNLYNYSNRLAMTDAPPPLPTTWSNIPAWTPPDTKLRGVSPIQSLPVIPDLIQNTNVKIRWKNYDATASPFSINFHKANQPGVTAPNKPVIGTCYEKEERIIASQIPSETSEKPEIEEPGLKDLWHAVDTVRTNMMKDMQSLGDISNETEKSASEDALRSELESINAIKDAERANAPYKKELLKSVDSIERAVDGNHLGPKTLIARPRPNNKRKYRPQLEDMTVTAVTRNRAPAHDFFLKQDEFQYEQREKKHNRPFLLVAREDKLMQVNRYAPARAHPRFAYRKGPVRRVRPKDSHQVERGTRVPQMTVVSKKAFHKPVDYFDDLVNWHSDILNIDSVTHSDWDAFIRTIANNEPSTPNIRALQEEIVQMKNFLNSLEHLPKPKSKLKQYSTTEKSKTIPDSVISKMLERNSNRMEKAVDSRNKEPNDRNVGKANNKNAHNFNDMYQKSVKAITKNFEVVPNKQPVIEPSMGELTVDTTLFAYDDSISLMSEEVNSRRTKNAKNVNNKLAPGNMKATVNLKPKQYFTTPIPMHTSDFSKFLKDHDMDVASLTSPINKKAEEKSKLTEPESTSESHHSTKKRDMFDEYSATTEDGIQSEWDYLEALQSSLVNDKYYQDLEKGYQDELFPDVSSKKVKRRVNLFKNHDKNFMDDFSIFGKKSPTRRSQDVDITIIDFDDKSKDDCKSDVDWMDKSKSCNDSDYSNQCNQDTTPCNNMDDNQSGTDPNRLPCDDQDCNDQSKKDNNNCDDNQPQPTRPCGGDRLLIKKYFSTKFQNQCKKDSSKSGKKKSKLPWCKDDKDKDKSKTSCKELDKDNKDECAPCQDSNNKDKDSCNDKDKNNKDKDNKDSCQEEDQKEKDRKAQEDYEKKKTTCKELDKDNKDCCAPCQDSNNKGKDSCKDQDKNNKDKNNKDSCQEEDQKEKDRKAQEDYEKKKTTCKELDKDNKDCCAPCQDSNNKEKDSCKDQEKDNDPCKDQDKDKSSKNKNSKDTKDKDTKDICNDQDKDKNNKNKSSGKGDNKDNKNKDECECKDPNENKDNKNKDECECKDPNENKDKDKDKDKDPCKDQDKDKDKDKDPCKDQEKDKDKNKDKDPCKDQDKEKDKNKNKDKDACKSDDADSKNKTCGAKLRKYFSHKFQTPKRPLGDPRPERYIVKKDSESFLSDSEVEDLAKETTKTETSKKDTTKATDTTTLPSMHTLPLDMFQMPFVKSIPINSQGSPSRIEVTGQTYRYNIIYDTPSKTMPVESTVLANNPSSGHSYQSHTHKKHNSRHIDYHEKNRNKMPTPSPNRMCNTDTADAILNLINIVQAVGNFTRPSAIFHIDLPTYYLPDLSVTEPLPKRSVDSWKDSILRYLSGISLVEMVSHLVDGVGDEVNASKVFSETLPRGGLKMDRRSRLARKAMWPKWKSTASMFKTSVFGSSSLNDLVQLQKEEQAQMAKPEELAQLPKPADNQAQMPNATRKRFMIPIMSRLRQFVSGSTTSTTPATTVTLPLAETTPQGISGPTVAVSPARPKNASNTATTVLTTKSSALKKPRKARDTKPNDFKTEEGLLQLIRNQTLKHRLKHPNDSPLLWPLTLKENTEDMLATPTVSKKDKEGYLETTTKAAKEKEESETPTLNIDSTEADTKNPDIYTNLPSRTTSRTDTTKSERDVDEALTYTKLSGEKNTRKAKNTEVVLNDNNDNNYEATLDRPDTTERYKLKKRDAQESDMIYTAKNVAAFEIIVDLMKEQESTTAPSTSTSMSTTTSKPASSMVTSHANTTTATVSTNAIQVHIAIPYSVDDKKRSVEPVRVRKVFAARMSAPVDLEYIIRSYEINDNNRHLTQFPSTTATATTSTAVKPKSQQGLYLFNVDSKNYDPKFKQADAEYNSKPLKYPVRHVEKFLSESTQSSRVEPTSMTTTSQKEMVRVTLTKDFIQSFNEQLLKLYQNLSAINEAAPDGKRHLKLHQVFKRSKEAKEKTKKEKKVHKRKKINWDFIRKYFKHDRVCDCKCTTNGTMCRACAASDAVITELLFEFDNLASYMTDHCTEIQTYFWMNPSGGRKLREVVHRIDKNLSDYFKRVKGKCKGRTCSAFQSYLDKRAFVTPNRHDGSYIEEYLVKDVEQLADDIKMATKLKVISKNHNLKERSDKLKDIVDHVLAKQVEKRDDKSAMRDVKSVYSLDNINVNIICNEGTSSSTPAYISLPTFDHSSITSITQDVTHNPGYLLYGEEEDNRSKKGLKKLFSKKKKTSKTNFKRECYVDLSTKSNPEAGFSFKYINGSPTDNPVYFDDSPNETQEEIEKRLSKNLFGLTALGAVQGWMTKTESSTEAIPITPTQRYLKLYSNRYSKVELDPNDSSKRKSMKPFHGFISYHTSEFHKKPSPTVSYHISEFHKLPAPIVPIRKIALGQIPNSTPDELSPTLLSDSLNYLNKLVHVFEGNEPFTPTEAYFERGMITETIKKMKQKMKDRENQKQCKKLKQQMFSLDKEALQELLNKFTCIENKLVKNQDLLIENQKQDICNKEVGKAIEEQNKDTQTKLVENQRKIVENQDKIVQTQQRYLDKLTTTSKGYLHKAIILENKKFYCISSVPPEDLKTTPESKTEQTIKMLTDAKYRKMPQLQGPGVSPQAYKMGLSKNNQGKKYKLTTMDLISNKNADPATFRRLNNHKITKGFPSRGFETSDEDDSSQNVVHTTKVVNNRPMIHAHRTHHRKEPHKNMYDPNKYGPFEPYGTPLEDQPGSLDKSQQQIANAIVKAQKHALKTQEEALNEQKEALQEQKEAIKEQKKMLFEQKAAINVEREALRAQQQSIKEEQRHMMEKFNFSDRAYDKSASDDDNLEKLKEYITNRKQSLNKKVMKDFQIGSIATKQIKLKIKTEKPSSKPMKVDPWDPDDYYDIPLPKTNKKSTDTPNVSDSAVSDTTSNASAQPAPKTSKKETLYEKIKSIFTVDMNDYITVTRSKMGASRRPLRMTSDPENYATTDSPKPTIFDYPGNADEYENFNMDFDSPIHSNFKSLEDVKSVLESIEKFEKSKTKQDTAKDKVKKIVHKRNNCKPTEVFDELDQLEKSVVVLTQSPERPKTVTTTVAESAEGDYCLFNHCFKSENATESQPSFNVYDFKTQPVPNSAEGDYCMFKSLAADKVKASTKSKPLSIHWVFKSKTKNPVAGKRKKKKAPLKLTRSSSPTSLQSRITTGRSQGTLMTRAPEATATTKSKESPSTICSKDKIVSIRSPANASKLAAKKIKTSLTINDLPVEGQSPFQVNIAQAVPTSLATTPASVRSTSQSTNPSSSTETTMSSIQQATTAKTESEISKTPKTESEITKSAKMESETPSTEETTQPTSDGKPATTLVEKDDDNVRINYINDTTPVTTTISPDLVEEQKELDTIEQLTKQIVTEACDSATNVCVCDMRATADHLARIQKTWPQQDFERFVQNLTCHKYAKLPKYFKLEAQSKPGRRRKLRFDKEVKDAPKKRLKWDWIRRKRSLLETDGVDDFEGEVDVDDDDDETVDTKAFSILKYLAPKSEYGVENENYFERLYKGEDSVYRRRKKKRRKRTAGGDMKQLILGLKNLPPLKPAKDEIYAMVGDSLSLECPHVSMHGNPTVTMSHAGQRFSPKTEVEWTTDRKDMLKFENVVMKHNKISINKMESKNAGNYSCYKSNRLHRVIKISPVALPTFHVVFIPMYSLNNCTQEDLRSLQALGGVMSRTAAACEYDSIKMSEPTCLEDKDDGSSFIRATGVLTSCPTLRLQSPRCSAQCRRDMQCSLALLCAANAPELARVHVRIHKSHLNKSLEPSVRNSRELIVTRSLRKKDVMVGIEFHTLGTAMYPGDLDVVVSCPAGYYLMPAYKICGACPADTYSGEGENTCYSCPPGTSSWPGAKRCHLSLRHLRKYEPMQWWMYPPCGYAMGILCCLCCCVLCAVCGLVAHVTSRSTACKRPASVAPVESRWTWSRRTERHAMKQCSSTSAGGGRGKQMSPSAVILARFFKSASSSRMSDVRRSTLGHSEEALPTLQESRLFPAPRACRAPQHCYHSHVVDDSQEKKFERWKRRNIPPPLPPIDFDLSEADG